MHLEITFRVNISEVEIFVTGKLKKRKKKIEIQEGVHHQKNLPKYGCV